MKVPMLKLLTLTALSASLAACAPNPLYEQQAAARSQAELSRQLAGHVAGAPQRCLPGYRAGQPDTIDANTILYRDGRTIWVQRPRGGCSGLGSPGNVLVTRKFGTSDSCDGDINQVVDLNGGFVVGACVFGPFTPYTKPR